MKKRSKKGFTLIELIVVVAILAILAAIAVPNFVGMTKKANNATEVAAASELANAVNIHNTMAAGDATLTAIIAVPASEADFQAALGNLYPTFDATYANVVARLMFDGEICSVDPALKGDLP